MSSSVASTGSSGVPPASTPIVLGRYRLQRVIGKGAMGEVWAARHELVDHEIAVKVVLDEDTGGELAARALHNEVATATGLDHPGVVSVLDHGRVDLLAHTASEGRMPVGGPFLVMELLHGRSMHEFIGRLTWLEVQDVLAQLLDALGHCHGRGVIHRDLKPGNILLGTGAADRRFRVVLMDFGLARFFEQPVERTETVAGTPAYMAPEQLQGAWRHQGPWTDLYSVGCLGWTLVTGAPPFGRRRSYEAFLEDHLHLRPPPLDPMIGVPVDVDKWLRRLLAKSPADRFRTAADARDALLALPSGMDDSPTLEPVAPPVRVGGHPEADSLAELDLGDLLSTADLKGEAGGAPLLEDDTQDVLGELVSVVPEASTADVLSLTASSAPLPPSWRLPRAVVRHPLDGVGLSLFGLRDPPLVGRLAERDLLWSTLLEVERTGEPQAVVLHGAMGVGRSRLAAWLCEAAHEQSGVLAMRAVHGLEGGADSGLVAMFQRHLRLSGLDPQQLHDHLRYQLGSPVVDDEELRALVAVLAMHASESGGNEVDRTRYFVEARERHMLFSRLLERLLVGGPLREGVIRPGILWLDDVHHSHEALAFAVHLMSATSPLPLLVVATSGDHEADVAQAILLARLQALAAQVVDLEGLPPSDHRALVDALLVFDPEVASHITERTAGNPQFAVQLVADWVQRGLLRAGPDGFTVPPEDIADAPVDPVAIWRRSLTAALAELDEAGREALEVAAALGGRVDAQEWRAVCARSRLRPSAELVEAAVRAQIVHRRPGGFQFAHRVIVDELRELAQTAGRSQRHHRMCATIVELRGQGSGPQTAARVARHLLRAGDTRDALSYLLQAARGFARVGETTQVIPLLESWETAANAVGVAADTHEWPTVWGLRLDALWLTGDKGHVRAVARLAASSRGIPQLAGLAHLHRGLAVYQRGAVADARLELSRAAASAESAGDDDLMVRVGLERGRLSLESGDLDGALRRLEAVRQQAHKLRDIRAEATAGWLLGRVAKQSGDLAQARSAFVAALTAFERVGDRNGLSRCTNELGELARLEGDLDAAVLHYRDALERMEALGSDNTDIVRVNLGLVLIEQGRLADARPSLEEARTAFVKSGRRALLATTEIALLACEAGDGRWQAWDRRSKSAERDLRTTGFVDLDVALALERAANHALAAGQGHRARGALYLAEDQWRALDRPDDLTRVQDLLHNV